MNIEAILFDWGGTLAQVVSQDERFTAGAKAAGALLGGDDCAEIDGLVRSILSAEAEAAAHPDLREASLEQRIHEWAACLPQACEKGKLRKALRRLYDAWPGSLEVFAGAPEALAELHGRGYRMGLVSNCMLPANVTKKELLRMGLGQHLDFAVFSSEVGYRKPSPRIYEEAVSRLLDDRYDIRKD